MGRKNSVTRKDDNHHRSESKPRSSSSSHVFDLDEMNQCFLACMAQDGLSLQKYSDGFKQIVHFFAMMGKIFAFVGSDVADKVKVIDELCSGEKAEEYQVIASCMEMEKTKKIAHLNTRSFASASRTLLRLHRAMDYIAQLFEALSLTTEREIGTLSKSIYQDTLAKYHSYVIKKAAEFGMVHGLPYKENLMQMIVQSNAKRYEKNNLTATNDMLPTLKSEENAVSPAVENGDKESNPETKEETNLSEEEQLNLAQEREIRVQLSVAAQTMTKCHKEIEALYTRFDMHELP